MFIVTRMPVETKLKSNSSNTLKVKRKNIVPNKLLSIYQFDSFDDFSEFCIYINSCPKFNENYSFKATLYYYMDKYYLVLKNIRLNLALFKTFCFAISEYAKFIHSPNLFEYKLQEYGKVIIKQNAIKTCLKYF